MKSLRSPFSSLAALLIIGQILFAIASSTYTAPKYEGKIYATIGIELLERSDLHKLNEAAHYFGQTIIGWTKFPHFVSDLTSIVELPESIEFRAHMQERQNIIFILRANEEVTLDHLMSSKNQLQTKLDEYNEQNKTAFVLANVDYEQLDVTRSYGFGAAVTLFLTIIVWLGWVYVRFGFGQKK